mmetsp:Transcript_15215/g.37352  ORF Transcript_15215/g.37352 Transcript_15215/m.37352 type:complete len:485 (-) Transcript_15215:477-1931(-)
MSFQMKNKTTAEVCAMNGPQEYTLAIRGSVPPANPMEIWNVTSAGDTSNKRIFTVDEMYDLFSKECVAFIGDSTDRRAADTLQILLSKRQNVRQIRNFFVGYQAKHASQFRPNIVDGVVETEVCSPGAVDNIWHPTYDKILQYKHRDNKNYTVIVAANGPQNHIQLYSPKQTRENIRKVIHHLHREIPEDVLLVWKTSVWSWYGEWDDLEDNETATTKGNIFLVQYANKVAKETILALNSTSRIVLDFSREICPYSWEERQPTNMKAESNDWNPWHMGAKARLLVGQMLTWEVARYRNSTPLLLSAGIGDATGTIESGKNISQNWNGTINGTVAANETISGSISEIRNDDNTDEIEPNSASAQATDPPVESTVQEGDSGTSIENAGKSAAGNTTVSGTFRGNITANVPEPLVDDSTVTRKQYIKAADRVPERQTLVENPTTSNWDLLRVLAFLVIVFGMRTLSRRWKSRNHPQNPQHPQHPRGV